MKRFLKRLASRKLLTTILAPIAVAELQRRGVPDDVIMSTLGVFGVYVAGQSFVDRSAPPDEAREAIADIAAARAAAILDAQGKR